MKRSPTLEGFKAVFSQPSLALAEIAWRWSVGFGGLCLLTFTLVEYLDTLPVTGADMLMLRTRQPALMGRALEHIVRGSALRLLEAGILLALAFAVAWVIVAALGRAATLQAMLHHFANGSSMQETASSSRVRSLTGLNFFRAAASVALVACSFGAIILGGAVFPKEDPSPGGALLLGLAILTFAGALWLLVNWFLSLASVFVVSEGEDTFGAMSAAVGFCRKRLGPILAVSFWFGLAHGVAFFFASAVAVFLLSFLAVLPGRAVFGLVVLVTVFYFAAADFLHVGRLAAYVFIAKSEEDTVLQSVESKPAGPPSFPQGRIDPDELILSDLPLPVPS